MSSSKYNSKLASTDEEWISLMKTDPKKIQFIRSMDDWKHAIDTSINSKEHPLYGCTEKEVQEFTNSLLFNNGGLATAYYGVVMNKLIYTQFVKLWEMFGIDLKLFVDYRNYKCQDIGGSCFRQTNWICTSNC